MSIPDLDLAELSDTLLQEAPKGGGPLGYRQGKSMFRDLVARRLGCSALTAEEIVETLEQRGYLKFHWETGMRSTEPPIWEVDPAAEH